MDYPDSTAVYDDVSFGRIRELAGIPLKPQSFDATRMDIGALELTRTYLASDSRDPQTLLADKYHDFSLLNCIYAMRLYTDNIYLSWPKETAWTDESGETVRFSPAREPELLAASGTEADQCRQCVDSRAETEGLAPVSQPARPSCHLPGGADFPRSGLCLHRLDAIVARPRVYVGLTAVARAYDHEAGRTSLMAVVRNGNRRDRSNVVFRDGSYCLRQDRPHTGYDLHRLRIRSRLLGAAHLSGRLPFDLARVYQESN